MVEIYGRRAYRYYNVRPDRSTEECLNPNLSDTDFVVQMTTSQGRYYFKFVSCETFYTWFRKLPEECRTFSEVVRGGYQKFRMDIDEKAEDIHAIRSTAEKMLERIGMTRPSLLIFDIETSYHIVLTNYVLVSNAQCKWVAKYLSSDIKGMDLGVYNGTQHFRLEGCTKHGQKRWKRRVGSKLTGQNFHEGVITSLAGTTKYIKSRLPSHKPASKIVSGPSDFDATKYPDFVVRWSEDNLVILDRTNASHCQQCDRVHDHEGAYISYGRFFCRRHGL